MNKKITLACSQCGTRNYSTTTKQVSDRLELKKFCNACNAHTIHRETK